MGKKVSEKVLVNCATCGKEKYVSQTGFAHNKTKMFYCDKNCFVPYSNKGKPAWNKGISPSEETRQKQSESHKGKKQSEESNRKRSESLKGKNTWTKGTHQSEETIAKKSEALKGHDVSEETRSKISVGNTGKKRTAEVRKAQSESRKGKNTGESHPMYGKHHTEESKAKMRGRTRSLETRKKLSDASKGKPAWNKGKKMSDEACKNNSEAQKRHYQELCKKLNIEPYSGRDYPVNWNGKIQEMIRIRDNRKCRWCGKSEIDNKQKLHVHHINFQKDDLSETNLISLCRSCHGKTAGISKREYWISIFSKFTQLKLSNFDDFHQSYFI